MKQPCKVPTHCVVPYCTLFPASKMGVAVAEFSFCRDRQVKMRGMTNTWSQGNSEGQRKKQQKRGMAVMAKKKGHWEI